MELYIGLTNQDYKKKNSFLYKKLAVFCLLLLISWIVLSFIEGGSVFKWIYSLHLFFWTIFMVFLGYGKLPFNLSGKAYFKINDN